MKTPLNKYSIGKIAERIVMNELEAHGYRATDLNKDGLSANADVLAAKDGKIWQIQVKGATNKENEKREWIQYGHCDIETISKRSTVFNRKNSFYAAQYVVLVAVKSPSKYRCFVLPTKKAEEAAQLNLDRYYRQTKFDGGVRMPGKVWVPIERSDKERTHDKRLDKEREILQESENDWDLK